MTFQKFARLSRLLYTLCCTSLAVYMVSMQVKRFNGNADVSTMTYRRFNEHSIDLYPTITFCFNPPLKSTAIKQYNLSPSVYMSFANIETNDYSEPISKIINKSFYLLGRDFIIETFNNSEEALEEMIFPLKQLHTG